MARSRAISAAGIIPRIPRLPNPPETRMRFARSRSPHHPARPAIAESSRDENAVRAVKQLLSAGLLERFRFNPPDVDPQPMLETAVVQRLVQALVGVFVADVLADDMNRDFIRGILDAVDEVGP